ncbi:hypothetical protein DSO57_1002652 [Entomophthora muscae]|uniref:Uncharacterized protein n=1 Tax=Entomophthora muscae TaxID=34485 RepID=A0ACC2TJZ7_9FUNG|nr:hypothetical protein DSO57_1002652 [Entomophthora muscae]
MGIIDFLLPFISTPTATVPVMICPPIQRSLCPKRKEFACQLQGNYTETVAAGQVGKIYERINLKDGTFNITTKDICAKNQPCNNNIKTLVGLYSVTDLKCAPGVSTLRFTMSFDYFEGFLRKRKQTFTLSGTTKVKFANYPTLTFLQEGSTSEHVMKKT